MRHPLHSFIRLSPFGNDAPHDRLCFSTQIPELGIFIVASPIGRIAIFALTKSLTLNPDTETKDWRFGFELEYILPFDKVDEGVVGEEGVDWGKRRLVGVSASPVQGDGRERWRIMAYWTDHVVRSWVVGRRGQGEELVV